MYAQLNVGVNAGSTVPFGHPLSLLYGGGSDTSSANQLAVREAASKPLGPPRDIQRCSYLVEACFSRLLSMCFVQMVCRPQQATLALSCRPLHMA